MSESNTKDRPKEETMLEKTGKRWDEWFRVLEEYGAGEKDHKTIAKHLQEDLGIDPWYAQTITVHYERERKGREPGRRSDGYFAVDVQRTVKAPVEKCWEAWTTNDGWNGWFTTGAQLDVREGGAYRNNDNDRGTFTKVEPHKRLQFTWEQKEHEPGSRVTIYFTPKGGSCAVSLAHEKLKTKKDADDLRNGGWNWAMDSFKQYVETGKGIRYEDWKQARES